MELNLLNNNDSVNDRDQESSDFDETVNDAQMEELLKFKDDSQLSFSFQINLLLQLIVESSGPIIQLISPNLGFFLGYFYLKSLNDPIISASLGLYISLMNFLCISFLTAIGEKLGVNCSEAIGSRNNSKVIKILAYSLTTSLIVFLFLMMIPNIFIYKILSLITNEKEVILLTSRIMHFSLPIQFALTIMENIKGYCYSHKIESWFGYISLINLFLSIPAMPFLIYTMDLGVYGFIINRLIFEFLNLFIYLIIANVYLPEESKLVRTGF